MAMYMQTNRPVPPGKRSRSVRVRFDCLIPVCIVFPYLEKTGILVDDGVSYLAVLFGTRVHAPPICCLHNLCYTARCQGRSPHMRATRGFQDLGLSTDGRWRGGVMCDSVRRDDFHACVE
jgi:hypothetical protein